MSKILIHPDYGKEREKDREIFASVVAPGWELSHAIFDHAVGEAHEQFAKLKDCGRLLLGKTKRKDNMENFIDMAGCISMETVINNDEGLLLDRNGALEVMRIINEVCELGLEIPKKIIKKDAK